MKLKFKDRQVEVSEIDLYGARDDIQIAEIHAHWVDNDTDLTTKELDELLECLYSDHALELDTLWEEQAQGDDSAWEGDR